MMGDASFNPAEHGVTKPRLSLLSSKQSGIRLKSEDDQLDQQITILSNTTDDYANIVKTNEKEQHIRREVDHRSLVHEKESQLSNRNTQNEENKMDISKDDLILLLSMLKSELHSKEIALAAIKCEQLKRLINPVEISRSSLASTYIELQDRFKVYDQNNNTQNAETQPTSASTGDQRNGQQENSKKPNNEENDQESLNILNTLLELLDRHPLLALPRDSIYCLDYNCNELSTKNYLNLKIQNLDSLINQHRRFRYYMNERLKRSEQRYLDLARELELERNLKYTTEKSMYKISGKSVFLKHIDELEETLEKERKDKQAIVMTLLNELLDERERIDVLKKKLESVNLNERNTGEKDKLLKMEVELNNLSMQLKKQSLVFTKEKNELQSKSIELERENANLKSKLEQQERRLTIAKSAIETKESNQAGNSHLSTRSTPGTKQTNPPVKQTSSSSAEVVTRNSSGTNTTKSSPTAKSSITAAQHSSNRVINPSLNNGTPQSSSTIRSNTNSSTNQRPSAPPIVSRAVAGSNTEHASIRIQPLFKSASVLSTNQQVRSLKTSVSISGSPNARASANNQPVTKPQVPAKPAQLLDQQRTSLN